MNTLTVFLVKGPSRAGNGKIVAKFDLGLFASAEGAQSAADDANDKRIAAINEMRARVHETALIQRGLDFLSVEARQRAHNAIPEPVLATLDSLVADNDHFRVVEVEVQP